MHTRRVSLLELSCHFTDIVSLVQCNMVRGGGDTQTYHESGRVKVFDSGRFVHMTAKYIIKRFRSWRMHGEYRQQQWLGPTAHPHAQGRKNRDHSGVAGTPTK